MQVKQGGNSLANRPQANPADVKGNFQNFICTPAAKQLIATALKDPKRAATFTATIVSAVNTNKTLAECKPSSVLAAGLQGAGLNLQYALGEFYLVPYGDLCTFITSYKGIEQLAIRSGTYQKISIKEVYQGQLEGYDRFTGDPIINWGAEPENDTPIGYYGYFCLLGGFQCAVYMTHDQILKHADTYVQGFTMAGYKEMEKTGKFNKPGEGKPWYEAPNAEGHKAMCRKTVIRKLLGDGRAPKSVELNTVLMHENEAEKGAVIYDMPSAEIPQQTETGNLKPETKPVKAEVPKQQTPPPQKKQGLQQKPQSQSQPTETPQSMEQTTTEGGQQSLPFN